MNEDISVTWIDILECPSLVRGTVEIASDHINFSKCSKSVIRETVNRGESYKRLVNLFKDNNSGCRICFTTNSQTIYVKGRLRRKWSHAKMTFWGGSGLDVYEIKNNLFEHIGVFGPAQDGEEYFSFSLSHDGENPLYIYLPIYNCVEELYVGIKSGCELRDGWKFEKPVPIIFFGNSVTQGAAASRSGNAYPNVVQRLLKQNIINLSFSGFCLGQKGIAEEIGKLNCSCIVIDYSRNEVDKIVFREKYAQFYSLIRESHPNVRIIFLSSFNFNKMREFADFDNIIKSVYGKAIKNGENVKFIEVMNCFSNREYDLLATDSCHLNDMGMYRIAAEIMQKIIET